jgi:glutaconyl-CoA decarboxylase
MKDKSEPTPLPHLPRVATTLPAAAVEGNEIIAPLPGTILSIQVNVGQKVEAGQVLCVLEAMKMKNPIRATDAGTVAEVAIEAGQTVAYGDLLVRLA